MVIINDGHGLRVEAHRIETNLVSVNYCCISHYFHFNIPFKQLYISNMMERYSYNGGCRLSMQNLQEFMNHHSLESCFNISVLPLQDLLINK